MKKLSLFLLFALLITFSFDSKAQYANEGTSINIIVYNMSSMMYTPFYVEVKGYSYFSNEEGEVIFSPQPEYAVAAINEENVGLIFENIRVPGERIKFLLYYEAFNMEYITEYIEVEEGMYIHIEYWEEPEPRIYY